MPLAEGTVWVGPVVCADQLFVANGEGTGADLWLANDRFRVVLRSPESALTLAGLGGGTVIDAAPWGRADGVHEIAPLVADGWLAVDTLDAGDDHVTVTGTVRSLPDRPPSAHDGEVRAVTWRVTAGSPWLEVEGADGLWVHPSDAMTWVDGWLASDRLVLGHDGTVDEDLGGAVRLRDAHRLLIGDPATAWAERPGPSQHVGGSATDAERIDLYRGAAVVGWLPVTDGTFDAVIPADVDALVARATAHADGPPTAPGEAVTVPVGDAGQIDLIVYWSGRPTLHPLRARWTDADGTQTTLRIPAGGASLPTGAGTFDLALEGGPGVLPVQTRVDVPAGGAVPVTMLVDPGVTATTHVLASLAWPGSRARTLRASAATRTSDAVVEGIAWAITTAEDDVEDAGAYEDDVDRIRLDDAVTLTSPAGWHIQAWPFRATPRRSGHGAPPVRDLDPWQAFAAAWGGDGVGRTTRVDLAWLALAADPWTLAHAPDLVALPAPGVPPFTAWSTWFAWLDAGRFLRPSGPYHWLDVGAATGWGTVDLERALTFARFSTGTGAWVDLTVDGVGPGAIVPRPQADTDTDANADSDTDAALPDGVRSLRVVVQRAGTAIDRVSLITDGGRVLVTHPVEAGRVVWQDTLTPGTWVAALAWSTTGDAWAVTAPTWLRSPAAVPDEVP
ncbi:MAG: hypothetical protein H6733_02145 [Alphaproteobacteria bacterium]|nr:hypothetical protein [Alphaproteobacteria bacterium]